MTRINKRHSLDDIQTDTSIPKEVKEILEELEPQDKAPSTLILWARNIFIKARQNGVYDR